MFFTNDKMHDRLAHLEKISARPGMYMLRETYECWAAYVDGYDAALDYSLLRGFREWTTMLFNQQANLVWSSVVLGLVTGDPRKDLQSDDENRAAIAGAFRLIASFVKERGDDLDAAEIRTRYSAWEGARAAEWE